jgi:hypothetical protein
MHQILHRAFFSILIPVFCSMGVKTFGFEKLDPKYTPSFGDPNAPVHMTEYFSLSCERCLRLINQDFPQIKAELIDTGKIYWTFHPDPADLLTLGLMVCLEKLNAEEKGKFFLLSAQKTAKNPNQAAKWMKEVLKFRGSGGEEYFSIAMIEKAPASRAAMNYLKQKDAPTLIPTIEVNGQLREEFPTVSFIKSFVNYKEHPCKSEN